MEVLPRAPQLVVWRDNIRAGLLGGPCPFPQPEPEPGPSQGGSTF